MRLIDADAFIASIPDFDLPEDTISACALRSYLIDAPTVDPVKHGHWINNGPNYAAVKCSVCGRGTEKRFVYGEDHAIRVENGTRYCKDCGACMDEEEQA